MLLGNKMTVGNKGMVLGNKVMTVGNKVTDVLLTTSPSECVLVFINKRLAPHAHCVGMGPLLGV